MNKQLIIAFSSLLLACIASFFVVESFGGGITASGALDHKTRCFSCERALPANMAWMGQPTKCFSCQAKLIHKANDMRAGYGAQTLKYYTVG